MQYRSIFIITYVLLERLCVANLLFNASISLTHTQWPKTHIGAIDKGLSTDWLIDN